MQLKQTTEKGLIRTAILLCMCGVVVGAGIVVFFL